MMYSSRQSTPHVVTAIFAASVAVNYPWELAQSPLFTPSSPTQNVWLHCFFSSLGDGIMVLLLFLFGWLAFGRRDWFVQPGRSGYLTLLATGVLLAILVEWAAVHELRRWTYSDAMPRIPGLDIGVVPIVQMMLLPALAFRIAAGRIAKA